MKKILAVILLIFLAAELQAMTLDEDYLKGVSGARGMALGGALNPPPRAAPGIAVRAARTGL